MKLYKQQVELLSITPNAEKLIEVCGKTCYQAHNITETSYVDFIKKLISNNHLSVLEHATATVRIVDKISIIRQLTRHRIGVSYSSESTRYCNYHSSRFENQIGVLPVENLTNEQQGLWESCIKNIEETYMKLIEGGVKAEDARDILPLCTKCEIVTTANLREWRWIFHERLSVHAHHDIVKLMKMVFELLYNVCPNVFGDLKDKGFLNDF